MGAFFDLDGTLVSGFTATAHAGDRIRRRQARIGEVLGVWRPRSDTDSAGCSSSGSSCAPPDTSKGESLRELDELGERLFVSHIESRVFPLMREVVAAHQDRGHTVALCSSALTIHAEPVARALGIDHAAVQSLRGRRQRSADRGHRAAGHLGRTESRCGTAVLRRQRRRPAAQLFLRRRRRRRRADVVDRPSPAGESAFRAGRGRGGQRLAGVARRGRQAGRADLVR